MKKKNHTLTGFGIGCIIVSAIIMIVHFYLKFDDMTFFMRIFEGLWRFGCVFAGMALIYLVLLAAFYAAAHLSEIIFKKEYKEDNLMDQFTALSDQFVLIIFIASYLLIFFEL